MAKKDQPAPPRPKTRLYLITPPQIDLPAFLPSYEAALAAGDIACIQLRLKNPDGSAAPADAVAAAAEALMPPAHARDIAFLLNDDPALAKALGCDGVHVGQDDAPYAEAREMMGDDAIIGVTCHNSKHLAMQAGEDGADYVAFGAFYDTATKDPKTRAEPDLLSFWQQFVELPCVAIGGITPDNAAPLVEAGADFIAASGGVWAGADGPAAAVARFNAVFDEQHGK